MRDRRGTGHVCHPEQGVSSMSFSCAARVKWTLLLWVLVGFVGQARAVEKGSEQVSPFFGSFGSAVAIEVPAYHGVEPGLALGYSSEGRNGFVGTGWDLSGFGTIERTNAGG